VSIDGRLPTFTKLIIPEAILRNAQDPQNEFSKTEINSTINLDALSVTSRYSYNCKARWHKPGQSLSHGNIGIESGWKKTEQPFCTAIKRKLGSAVFFCIR